MSDDAIKDILYNLHGYDKGEVPLLDLQIEEAAQQIRQELELARLRGYEKAVQDLEQRQKLKKESEE